MTFDGKWRITSMELWDREAFDMVVPAYFQFDADRMGEFQFIVVHGCIDCKYSEHDGRPFVEFTWEGEDDGHSRCGRGWAVIAEDGALAGRFFFHRGDDSAFTAVRLPGGKEVVRPRRSSLARRSR